MSVRSTKTPHEWRIAIMGCFSLELEDDVDTETLSDIVVGIGLQAREQTLDEITTLIGKVAR